MENEISETKEMQTDEAPKTENETVDNSDTAESPTTEQPPVEEGSSETVTTDPTLDGNYSDIQTVLPIEIREHTPFVTEAGDINVIHEITLGDLLVSTVLMAILIFQVMTTFFRRY